MEIVKTIMGVGYCFTTQINLGVVLKKIIRLAPSGELGIAPQFIVVKQNEGLQ